MEKFNEQLKDFLSSLDRKSAKRARTLIARACMTNTRKVYNWTNVGVKITPLERMKIEETLNKRIFIES